MAMDGSHSPGFMPYTEALGALVCEFVAVGHPLDFIAEQSGMPARRQVFKWLQSVPEFAIAYDAACNALANVYAAEIVEIADNEELDPRDRKVKIETRQWLMERLRRERWAATHKVEHSGEITLGLSDRLESARRRAVGRVVDVTPEVRKLGNDAESDKDE